MGNFIKLKAKDGHGFGADEAWLQWLRQSGLALEANAVLARRRTPNFLPEKVG